MKEHKITVHCEWDIDIVVEADDDDIALAMAEQEVASRYIVFGKDEEEYYPFDDIFAYKAKDSE